MAMHGHTRIELQDVVTGGIKVVEDDNMVTDGLVELVRPTNGWANIFNSFRFYEDYNVNKKSFLDTVLGGIFCFEETQEESPGHILPDAGNRVVAKASNYAYSGSDITQGGYNLSESGFQDDGSYKKVWDFSTNQGNGTIASVSLTTCYGGQFGEGSPVPDAVAGIGGGLAGISVYANSRESVPVIALHKYNRTPAANVCYADYANNEILFADQDQLVFREGLEDKYFYNSGKIILLKSKVPFSKISPFTNPMDLHFESEEIEINVPEQILAQCQSKDNAVGIYDDEGYIYMLLIKNTSVEPNGALQILKIKATDFTTEVISLTNTSPVSIHITKTIRTYGPTSGHDGLGINITNDYFTFQSYRNGGDGKVYRISLKNNTDIREVKMNGEDFSPLMDYSGKTDWSDYCFSFSRIGDRIYMEGVDSQKGYLGYVINIKTCEAYCAKKYIDGSVIKFFKKTDSTKNSLAFIECHGSSGAIFYSLESADDYYNQATKFYVQPVFRSDILLTVNNIPEPVFKTASQTMKITYTITEE